MARLFQATIPVLLALYSLPFAMADYPYKTMYFDQTIDHFNFKSHGNQTFKQRYLITEDYWKGGSYPIFVYTGNEADITLFLQNTGFLYDIAPQFGALVIFAEHRYYGESLPFGNQSYTAGNVGLLAIEQVLADYATLIQGVKKQLKADNAPVVAFGGSYGGMLSAYLRFKYPNVVVGAISSGGPIISAAGIGSQTYYFEDVTKIFNSVEASPRCVPTIKQGFAKISELAMQGRAGLDQISNAFRLCNPLQTQSQVHHLLLWIRNSLATLTTVNYPYPAAFEGNLPAWPVNVSCAMITNSSDPLQGLADGSILFYNGTHGSLKCIDIYGELMECSDATGCGSQGWDYQVCTEVTRPAGTNGVTDMFPSLPFTEKMRERTIV
ncbi:dipeptidyl peptidase 2-like [Patiria miniata]|uniref:Lysosomal Pro-X carboxypeptidase n=1 Tax=Patiria miniata TaxID=46514 RepID=A0A914AK49_PATMI|nr:dipeptidyl peptidase 2-like [Patiria miniata]